MGPIDYRIDVELKNPDIHEWLIIVVNIIQRDGDCALNWKRLGMPRLEGTREIKSHLALAYVIGLVEDEGACLWEFPPPYRFGVVKSFAIDGGMLAYTADFSMASWDTHLARL